VKTKKSIVGILKRKTKKKPISQVGRSAFFWLFFVVGLTYKLGENPETRRTTMVRKCPVCRVGVIVRKEVKTCGAMECITIWRTMTVHQRAQAMEEADLPMQTPDFKPLGGTPAPTSMPDKATERDRKYLEKIFGDDPTKKDGDED
jgi:hypothetical protein